MLELSDSPWTTIVTRAPYLARCTAACPAEFPASTTYTSQPLIARASLAAAP
jgi:hypothetical protein